MRSTVAEINLSSLRHNVNVLRSLAPEKSIMAIVKANAYGHGMVEISKALRKEGIDFLGVAFPEEGMELRQSGDIGQIVVIYPGKSDDAELVCEGKLEVALASVDVARKISDEALSRNMVVKAHLFIDSGMHRDGIAPHDATQFMKECSSLTGIDFCGIMTHFATADSEDKSFAYRQIEVFRATVGELADLGYRFHYMHACNSAAIAQLPEAQFDLVRPGFMLYGCMPDERLALRLGLQPIINIKSKVTMIIDIKQSDTVGYGLRYIAGKDSRVAVVPFGYGDGYLRANTNKSQCLIGGKRYNIVGTICMDMCMADVGNDPVKAGDEVVFLGSQGDDQITCYELAAIADTIPYEITTSINKRVPRVFVE